MTVDNGIEQVMDRVRINRGIEARKTVVATGLFLATTNLMGPERYLDSDPLAELVNRVGGIRDVELTSSTWFSLLHRHVVLHVEEDEVLLPWAGYKVNPEILEAIEASEALLIPTLRGQVGRSALKDIVEQTFAIEAKQGRLQEMYLSVERDQLKKS